VSCLYKRCGLAGTYLPSIEGEFMTQAVGFADAHGDLVFSSLQLRLCDATHASLSSCAMLLVLPLLLLPGLCF
jgi:hypothetical protein